MYGDEESLRPPLIGWKGRAQLGLEEKLGRGANVREKTQPGVRSGEHSALFM